MAFREVTAGNAIDIKQNPNEPFEGIYLGHREIESAFGGTQIIWQFRGKEGAFGVFGFTMLNRALESIAVGSLCRLTFTGKQKMKTKRGIVDVNTVRVEVDDGTSADTDDMPDTYPATREEMPI